MKKPDKIDYYNLRKMLEAIYACASAWDNDDGKMAEANEKTPEDILFKIIKDAEFDVLEKVRTNINCEVDCIQSGNQLAPIEQQIALTVCENIKKRCEL